MQDIPSESVDLILTDPPYAINYRSNRRTFRPQFDFLHNDSPGEWIETFARESYRILKPDSHLYCFTRHDVYIRFFTAFEGAGFKMKRTLVWVKNNHGSGDLKGDYAPRDEWIIFCSKGRRHLNGKRSDNTLFYNTVSSHQRRHPTEKPVDMLSFLISKSTQPGDLVIDPFAGALSTGVAAMDNNCSFLLLDLEQRYLSEGINDIISHPEVARYDIKAEINK